MAKLVKNKSGYPIYRNSGIPVHKAVAQNKIGRRLRPKEVVHHHDGNKSNFKKRNLSVMRRSFHSTLHTAKRKGFWS